MPKEAGIPISMDGRGRALDNILIERFWRTLKDEEVYLIEYQTVKQAKEELSRYLEFIINNGCISPLAIEHRPRFIRKKKVMNLSYKVSRLSNPLISPAFLPKH
jgi:transposase InsO family protein